MKVMFAISLVLIFLLSVAGAAFAAGNMGTFHGQITAINTESGTIALKTFEPVVSPSKAPGFVFRTNDMTMLTTCNGSGNFSDLKVGDVVDLKYQVKSDAYVAQNIVQSGRAGAPLMACR